MYLLAFETAWNIHTIWSKSLLSAWRNFGFLAIQNAHSEESDQTAWRSTHINFHGEIKQTNMSKKKKKDSAYYIICHPHPPAKLERHAQTKTWWTDEWTNGQMRKQYKCISPNKHKLYYKLDVSGYPMVYILHTCTCTFSQPICSSVFYT